MDAALLWRHCDAARWIDRESEQCAIHGHACRGEIERASVSALRVARLIVRSRKPRRGEGARDAPSRMIHRESAGVDAVVRLAGRGVLDVHEIPAAQQARGLHDAALIPVVAAGDVNRRAAAHDDRSSCLHVHRAAVHGELRHIALDDSREAGHIAERCADPVASVVHTRAADVHRERHATQRTRALQRRIGEFAAAEFNREDALRKRHRDFRAPGHIDQSAGIEVDLSAGKKKPLGAARREFVQPGFLRSVREQRRAVAVGIRVRPHARAQRDVSARCEEDRILREMNRETLDIDLRTLRQRRAGHRLRARVIGQDARDAPAAKCDRARVLKKERRPAGCARAGVVEIRISDRAVARDQINAPVQAHARRAVRDAELVHRAPGHRDVARRCGNDAAVRGRPGAGFHAADPHVNSAEARIVVRMRGDRDLVASSENRLSARRRDRAVVRHVRPHEHHASAVAVTALRAADLRALLHGDRADFSARRRLGDKGGRAIRSAGHRHGREEELRIAVVQQPLLDQVLIDRKRRRDERARVHLRGAAEDDAVLIDDIHLPLRRDGAEDLRRHARRIADLVECDPLPGIRAARALIKVQRRLLAHVERLPIQHRLLRSLLHVHDRLSA